jgi:hypothetical protein
MVSELRGLAFQEGEREYLKYAPRHIFITHLHPNHVVLDPEQCAEGEKFQSLANGIRVIVAYDGHAP